MALGIPAHSTASEPLHSALAQIAAGAPLADTLSTLIAQLDGRDPAAHSAVLVWDDDGVALRLQGDCAISTPLCAELACVLLAAGTSASYASLTPAALAANALAQRLQAAASAHGLPGLSITPICTAPAGLLGLWLVFTRAPNPRPERAVIDSVLLASIAITRSHASAKLSRAEQQLRDNESRVTLAIDGSATGIWDRNVVSGEIHYSRGWKALFGYAEHEVSNRIEDSYVRVHPDDLATVRATIEAHFAQKTAHYAVEHRIRCKDGSYKWIASRGKVISRDEAGRPLRMIGTSTDITATKALSHQLQQSMDLIVNLTNEVPGLLFQYRMTAGGRACFPYASEGIADIYELDAAQVAGTDGLVDALIHPEDRPVYHASLHASCVSLQRWHLEYRVVLPRQGVCWRLGSAQPRRLADGATLWHGFITDITERKRIEGDLHLAATTDFLTGLPNRRNFMARMNDEQARVARLPNARAVVLMFDLDLFKAINDGHGHAMGDAVLIHFAQVLACEVRKIDAVGRIGGEEFAVILAAAGEAEAQQFAQRVQASLAVHSLQSDGHDVDVTVSVGISAMRAADRNVDAALSRADMALYRAKECGRDRIEIAAD